jgi:hypothetical protein
MVVRGVNPMRIESLDPKMKRLLTCIPQKNEDVEWVEEEGKVVLIYPKNFTRFEKLLHRHIGGPDNIRRPLDDKGTFIWRMCDGEHSVHEICQASYDEFHEDIEPVLRRVWGFLETLLSLNLISMELGNPEEQENSVEDDEHEKEKGEEEKG